MHARVTRMWLKEGGADALVEGAKAYMARKDDKPAGFRGALLLIAEDGQEATSVTFWSSKAAIEASEAGGGYAQVMAPFEPLFRKPYERTLMRVGSTTLLPPEP
jgi:heme-degrading monooxygenase HmoA